MSKMDAMQDFKLYVAKYGIRVTYECMNNYISEARRDINEILTLLNKPSVEAQNIKIENQVVKIENQPVENQDQIKNQEIPDEPIKKSPKKCVKKSKPIPENNNVENTSENITVENTETDTIENNDINIVSENGDQMDEKERKKNETRENNRKAKQRQADAQKLTFQKNKDKGINPYDLLTAENLHKWLIIEERTCAYIAKNIIGCTDKEVSLAAKRFEIKSLYMGENGMIKAGRRKTKKD